MKIESIANTILNESNKKIKPKSQSNPGTIEDKADIRDSSGNIENARNAVDSSPETRDQLVEQLKQDILSGDYKINLQNIAEKLLEYHTQNPE